MYILALLIENFEAEYFSYAQTVSDAKRPSIAVELQKLVSEWPLDVIKHQDDDNRKAFSFPYRFF